MKRKDYLLVAFVPLGLLLLPLAGHLTVEGWHWTWHDFLFAWILFTFATWLLRFLMTRPMANLPYKAGVALAVVTGFVITWGNLAVQIIGEDNPGNVFYLLTIFGGFAGGCVARFRPAGLVIVAFSMAASFLVIPVIAVLNWPADFDPGYPRVQLLSSVLAAIFATSGFLFRRASGQA